MTPEEIANLRARQEAHRTLIPRLQAGDALHREAAIEILRLKQEVKEAREDEARGARDTYAAGQADERESHDW